MKKLLVLALTGIFVLGFAAATMAEATLSGEVDFGVKGDQTPTVDSKLYDYGFGKMTLNGKLGDNLTGVLVFKSEPVGAYGTANGRPSGAVVVDEADVTFTQDFGTVKVGYFGWNVNQKDILDVKTSDVKTNCVLSGTFNVAEGISVGAAVAVPDTRVDEEFAYGLNVSYNADVFGGSILFIKPGLADGNDAIGFGLDVYYKVMDPLKVFVEARDYDEDFTNCVVGAVYDSADVPFYGRVEVDALKNGAEGDDSRIPIGIRVGYKMSNGAKIEGQYVIKEAKDTSNYYAKLIVPF